MTYDDVDDDELLYIVLISAMLVSRCADARRVYFSTLMQRATRRASADFYIAFSRDIRQDDRAHYLFEFALKS